MSLFSDRISQMNTDINIWEPIIPVVLVIFLTCLLFFMIYLAAFAVVKGGMFTYRKITEEIKKEIEPKNKDLSSRLDNKFPKREDVIKHNQYKNKRY